MHCTYQTPPLTSVPPANVKNSIVSVCVELERKHAFNLQSVVEDCSYLGTVPCQSITEGDGSASLIFSIVKYLHFSELQVVCVWVYVWEHVFKIIWNIGIISL